uniref:Uncharacterized protein n=1 Tax=Amphilophus citrinellus TaxID=61819 RepID=A0A3Q0QQ84_AMPCI
MLQSATTVFPTVAVALTALSCVTCHTVTGASEQLNNSPERSSLMGASLVVTSTVQQKSDTEFWDKMQAEWEELARRNWLEDSEDQRPIPPTVSPAEKGYYFNTNNPYRDWPNAFAEGQEKAREGDLNAAVLLLEAAILQDPQDSEAWQLLGMTQAENENEQAAIVSLQRSDLGWVPDWLQAGAKKSRKPCHLLLNWFGEPHLEYPVFSIFRNDITSLIQCAVGGGVGATSSAKASGDYLLWNRLGATLANGNRSEEAVEAYTRALELQPGFIRSRYNLGISCINLGAHREAVSNFLTALNQQRRSQRCSQQQMSANIWAALRIAISMMDRPELFQAANMGDLDLLMRAFDMSDV